MVEAPTFQSVKNLTILIGFKTYDEPYIEIKFKIEKLVVVYSVAFRKRPRQHQFELLRFPQVFGDANVAARLSSQ